LYIYDTTPAHITNGTEKNAILEMCWGTSGEQNVELGVVVSVAKKGEVAGQETTPSTTSTEFSRSPAALLRLASHSGSLQVTSVKVSGDSVSVTPTPMDIVSNNYYTKLII